MDAALPFRYLAISERSVCPEPVPDRLGRLDELGVPALQIRDKSEPDRRRLEWIRSLPADRSARLLVNGRADLALLGGADGVHRSTRSLGIGPVRSICAPRRTLVGASTHAAWEVHNAHRLGADYVTFGPVFPTPSKPDLDEGDIPGLDGLEAVCDRFDIPVLALGGIGPDRVGACLRRGAYGVAGIRALFEPEDPAPVWERIRGDLPPVPSD